MPSTLKSVNGQYRGIPTILRGVEADSQAYNAFDLLGMIGASKKLQTIVADATDWDTTSTVLMAGIGLRAARGNTGYAANDVPYMCVDNQLLLRLPFWYTAGVAASAEYRDFVEGQKCCLRNVAGTFVANIANVTNPTLILVAKEQGIAATEPFWWGYFKVVQSMRAAG